MISEKTKDIIFSRLQLAQQLLEESDGLAGRDGYDLNGKNGRKWCFHPRHEREALVVYLLLTCFDKLGQKRSFTTFPNWLRSHKVIHTTEKENILNSFTENIDIVESSVRLFEGYQSIYGVRNAFYEGIKGLPENAKKQLFESVKISFCAEFGMHGPNVSLPSKPLEDKGLELDLKLKYLYSKRNRFTHKLDQYHICSAPIMSGMRFKNGSSWVAMIENKRIAYIGSHHEHETVSPGGAYVYTIDNWPFALFETIYGALGVVFERTSIKLKFRVMVFSEDRSTVTTYNAIDHRYLKNYDTFLRMTKTL